MVPGSGYLWCWGTVMGLKGTGDIACVEELYFRSLFFFGFNGHSLLVIG